jgi:hypothetical protein
MCLYFVYDMMKMSMVMHHSGGGPYDYVPRRAPNAASLVTVDRGVAVVRSNRGPNIFSGSSMLERAAPSKRPCGSCSGAK